MKDMRQADFRDGHAVTMPPCDEVVWIAQWRQTGSRAALDLLLRANSGRIRAMARVWSRDTHRQDDLVSEGMLALIGCLAGYIPHDGVPFFAYARPFVRAAMRKTYFRDVAIVAVPMHHVRSLQEGRCSDLDRAFMRAATCPERLDAPDAPELGVDTETAEAAIIRSEADMARSSALDAALAALTDTERLFIERRRADGDAGIGVLAGQVGLSQTQARKIEARALARLRAQLIMRGVTSACVGCGA
jgi:RNA polymerase sigma factor (sigma-70 family)